MKKQIYVEYTYLSEPKSIPLKIPTGHDAENLPPCTLEELARIQIPQHISTWTKYNAQIPITHIVFKINGSIIHDIDDLMRQLPNNVVRISGNLMKNNE